MRDLFGSVGNREPYKPLDAKEDNKDIQGTGSSSGAAQGAGSSSGAAQGAGSSSEVAALWRAVAQLTGKSVPQLQSEAALSEFTKLDQYLKLIHLTRAAPTDPSLQYDRQYKEKIKAQHELEEKLLLNAQREIEETQTLKNLHNSLLLLQNLRAGTTEDMMKRMALIVKGNYEKYLSFLDKKIEILRFQEENMAAKKLPVKNQKPKKQNQRRLMEAELNDAEEKRRKVEAERESFKQQLQKFNRIYKEFL